MPESLAEFVERVAGQRDVDRAQSSFQGEAGGGMFGALGSRGIDERSVPRCVTTKLETLAWTRVAEARVVRLHAGVRPTIFVIAEFVAAETLCGEGQGLLHDALCSVDKKTDDTGTIPTPSGLH